MILYKDYIFAVVINQWTNCVEFTTKIKDLRFDLRFVTRRFEIWGKNGIWDLGKWFKSVYWMIWDLTMRFDLGFAHHCYRCFPLHTEHKWSIANHTYQGIERLRRTDYWTHAGFAVTILEKINKLTIIDNLPSVLWHCWLGGRKGIRPVKNGGWWRRAMLSPDGVALSRIVGVSASVNLPLHHKVLEVFFWGRLTKGP